jgi:hypothetical protein
MLQSNNRKYAIALVLMMLFSVTTVLGAGMGDGSGSSGPPGPPGDADRVNRPDTVPSGFAYMYNASGPQVFQFRNMTMQFHANMQMEMNISCESGLRLQYLDIKLQLRNSLMLHVNARLGPPEGIDPPRDGVYHYLEIEPNNTEGIQARMRLYIDEEEMQGLANRSINRHQLRWSYWNGSDWAPVHSWMDDEGFLVCDTNHFSSWTVREMKDPPSMHTPNIPGIPEHAKAYNYSHMTPQGFQWTTRENEGLMFAFQNMNMLLNCTRSMEMNITAGDGVVERLFRLQLNPGEPVQLRMNIQLNPMGDAEAPEMGIGFYAEIESNGTGPMNAKLALHVDAEMLQQKLNREVNTSQLRWAYWSGSAWQVVDSTLDDESVLECETDHFSTWTILEVAQETGDVTSDDEKPGGIPGFPYHSVVIGVLLATLIAYMFRDK